MPVWEPKKWNSDIFIKRSHNCYTYAMDILQTPFSHKIKKFCKKDNGLCPRPQPGMKSGKPDITGKKFTIQRLVKYIKLDFPTFKKYPLNKKMPVKCYRIAIFLKEDYTDYHFYRQDYNGLWSHKDGWKTAKNKDAKGRLITDPIHASKLDNKYPIFAGFYIKTSVN